MAYPIIEKIKPWLNPAAYSASTKNWVRGLTALGILASGTGSLAFLTGGISALYGTLAVNIGISALTAWYSKEIVFWLYSIKPVAKDELVEGFDLHKMVEEIAANPHIACKMPDLGIYETDKLNAFATGRHTGHAGVAVTRGLLKYAKEYAPNTQFTAEELVKAVLYHELGHVSHHDVAIQSAVAILSLLFTKMCHIAYDRVINVPNQKPVEDKDKKDQKKKEENTLYSKLLIPAVFVLGWTGSTISKLLSKWFSRTRETCADETAFECGYGPQLAAALQMLEAGSKKDIEPNNVATNHFFGEESFGDALFCHHHAHGHESPADKKESKGIITWAYEKFSSHPTIEDRVEHLAQLEQERNAKLKVS